MGRRKKVIPESDKISLVDIDEMMIMDLRDLEKVSKKYKIKIPAVFKPIFKEVKQSKKSKTWTGKE